MGDNEDRPRFDTGAAIFYRVRELLATRTFPALALASLAVLAGAASASSPAATPDLRVLVFTKTAGFRHASIPAAVAAIRQLGTQDGYIVDATEDATAFSDQNLGRYAAVAFVLTSGDVLDNSQQAAFERYIGAGGGFVGVHSASDTEYEWPWYGALVGAYFKSHPAIQTAVLGVADDPLTAGLPRHWTRTDEWYDFQSHPQGVNVLATIDETTYDPGEDAMGSGHPIVWSHSYEGGRAWYTAGGHTDESYAEPLFLAHLASGIRWAAGLVPAAAPAAGRAAAPDPARIVSLTALLRRRRLVVTVRHPACPRCYEVLRVQLRGRRLTTTVAADGTVTTAISPTLPIGHWQFLVVLANRATGVTASVRRSIRVP
jgi:type 1 glutamine amidotransferase